MVTTTLVVLAVLLVSVALLLALAAVQRRRGERPAAAPASWPAIGSPARVWLERGERAAQRFRALGTEHPVLSGAADDADAVLAELQASAAEVATLDAARARLSVSSLEAELRRLDGAIAAAGGGPAEHDLRTAHEAVAGRLAIASRHRAASDAVVARMRAAVAGMEQAEDELVSLLAAQATAAGTESATVALAQRLAGLREGLAEVRAISARVAEQGQGGPGDVPGSVEGPPRT